LFIHQGQAKKSFPTTKRVRHRKGRWNALDKHQIKHFFPAWGNARPARVAGSKREIGRSVSDSGTSRPNCGAVYGRRAAPDLRRRARVSIFSGLVLAKETPSCVGVEG
jgi:hypothetical protein